MRRVTLLLLLLLLSAVAGMAVAACAVSAAQSPVVLDSGQITLDKGSSGDWSGSLGVTNYSDQSIPLSATSPPGCAVTLDPSKLGPAQHTSVKLTVASTCTVGSHAIDVQIAAGTTTLSVAATAKKQDPTPDWNALWAFVVAFAAALALAIGIVRALGCSLEEKLQYLQQTWSFKDSWVSNITVIGGLLTGVFGSSTVVKALGSNADNAVALATVGAAVAAALVAAGGIVVVITKWDGEITAGGLAAASSLTLAGAAGELWTVFQGGRVLELGGWQNRLVYPLAVALGLLTIYGIRALIDTLVAGTTQPPKPKPSDTITAATMLVAALKAQQSEPQRQAVNAELDRIGVTVAPQTPDEAKSSDAERRRHSRRRQTALL